MRGTRASLLLLNQAEGRGLEFEPETELRAVWTAEGGSRSLAAAISVGGSESSTVEVGVHVVAGIRAISDVVHFPENPEFHVFANLEDIGGAQVKLDVGLSAEGVGMYFGATQVLAAVSAGAVDSRTAIAVEILASLCGIRATGGSLENGGNLESVGELENSAGGEAIALVKVSGSEFTGQKFAIRSDVQAAASVRGCGLAAPTARPGDHVTDLKLEVTAETALEGQVDSVIERTSVGGVVAKFANARRAAGNFQAGVDEGGVKQTCACSIDAARVHWIG